VSRFLREITERAEALPGVKFAGATSVLALTGMDAWRNFTIPGQAELPYGQQNNSGLRLVTPHYFQAMSLRLVKGRYFEERDRVGAAEVAIINETLARRFFPNEDPTGKHITVADAGTPEAREIVGVVGDTRHHDFSDDPVPEIYRPFYQAYWPFAGLVVRTSEDPLVLAKAVQQTIWSVNKDQPVADVMSMEQRAANSMAPRRADMILLGLFAAIALLLTVIGVYGVMAYSVSRRTHEIGIRMALGARDRQVLSMVLGKALALAACGIAIGLLAAAAMTRFMQSLLVDLSATDATTFVFVPLLLCAVGVLAAYVPARRASKVDPLVALRYE
jgi:putative ABC transport system permease protein